MKNFNLSYFCIVSFGLIGCADNGVTPPSNPLQLAIQDISCTGAFLKLSLAASESQRTLILKREDSTIVTLTLVSSDSLIEDPNLSPNKTFTYTLVKPATQNTKAWSVVAQVTTLDTTSHVIQWQTLDTLGTLGLIRDVWTFSRNNAWAVGEFYLNDSTGKPDMAIRYNAANWDGQKWRIQRIAYNYQGQPGYNPIQSLFALSPNDIWFCGNGIEHFTGSQFNQVPIPSSVWGPYQMNRLWGLSSSDMFLVGNGGSMAHYSNGRWTKITSNTTVDLQDVWGTDGSHVWATGTNDVDGHCVVLQYDGNGWSTIYDNTNRSVSDIHGFSSIWTSRVNRIYLAGESGVLKMDLATKTFEREQTGQQWTTYSLRGTGINDIFESGAAGEAIHFNGQSWYLYQELRAYNNASAFVYFYTLHSATDFVVVGGQFFTGLNGFPVIIRGYR